MSELHFKKALRLEYLTVGYNAMEAAISLIAGYSAGSVALVGFGLDSIVESLSGFVLIWRLKKHGVIPEEKEEQVERLAERFVGVTFMILGFYVGIESVMKIIEKQTPEISLVGMTIAILSLIIMPVLAKAKLKLGKILSLDSLVADAKETLVCAWLSAALLVGLGLNAAFGFWLADPIVGLVIVGFLFKEGAELIFKTDEE